MYVNAVPKTSNKHLHLVLYEDAHRANHLLLHQWAWTTYPKRCLWFSVQMASHIRLKTHGTAALPHELYTPAKPNASLPELEEEGVI